MSRANYWLPAARWGAKMGDQVVLDSLTGALSDPFDALHMGVTAENIAAKYGYCALTGLLSQLEMTVLCRRYLGPFRHSSIHWISADDEC